MCTVSSVSYAYSERLAVKFFKTFQQYGDINIYGWINQTSKSAHDFWLAAVRQRTRTVYKV